jgi:hypothetical protein
MTGPIKGWTRAGPVTTREATVPKVTVDKVVITYKVKKVSLTKDSSVGKYLNSETSKDGLDQVLDGLVATPDWTIGFEVTKKKGKPHALRASTFGYPEINKHPGHVHGKGWKYKAEGGKDANKSVDRLVVSDTEGEIDIKSNEAEAMTVEIDISCKVKVLKDTH